MTTYEKLTLTADHLEQNVRDDEFNIGICKSSCGTVGCAIGHASDIPRFKDMGLGLILLEDTSDELNLFPCFEGSCCKWAIKLFYGLGIEEVKWLFYAESYGPGLDRELPTRANVIARIRSVAAEYAEVKREIAPTVKEVRNV